MRLLKLWTAAPTMAAAPAMSWEQEMKTVFRENALNPMHPSLSHEPDHCPVSIGAQRLRIK
jgi:hypothetical protein